MPRRTIGTVVFAVLILAASACSSTSPNAGSTNTPTAGGTPSIPDLRTVFSPLASEKPGASDKPIPGSTFTPPPSSDSPGPSPSPITFDWTSTVPVEATITPSCVTRGGTAQIVVMTKPKVPVAYHAVYAGTKGGAPPPYGYGYGGDNRGTTNGEGRYTDTWVVSINAPVGPARADVIVADGEAWGYDDPPFTVAGPLGC